MANLIKLKRSAVAGKAPAVGDLSLGELALNTYDGKLYTKKDDGTASIVEIGAAGVAISQFAQVINQDITFASGFNGLSVGPVEVAATYAVTVPANANWVVL